MRCPVCNLRVCRCAAKQYEQIKPTDRMQRADNRPQAVDRVRQVQSGDDSGHFGQRSAVFGLAPRKHRF